MKIRWIGIMEFIMLIVLSVFYVIPNWNERKTLSFTDLLVLELFFFIFSGLYKRNKQLWK